jgi:hypothetical protein
MRYCEKCGKEHDGSFATGRFCNRRCANSRVRTPEIKEKTSKTLRETLQNNPRLCNSGRRPGRRHPDKICVCVFCHKDFTAQWNSRKETCSPQCKRQQQSVKTIEKVKAGQIKSKSIRCEYLYRGHTIRCDSLMECACLDWCEHNLDPIDMKRSTLVLEYADDDTTRRYLPDFEIKNSKNELIFVECKSQHMSSHLSEKWHRYKHTSVLKKQALEEYALEVGATVVWFDANTMHKHFYCQLQIDNRKKSLCLQG